MNKEVRHASNRKIAAASRAAPYGASAPHDTPVTIRKANPGSITSLSPIGAIIHELNNPLTIVKAEAEELLETLGPGRAQDAELLRAIQNIKDSADRMRNVMQELKQIFGKTDGQTLQRCNLNHVLRESLSMLRPKMEGVDVSVEVDLTRELPDIWANPVKLRSIFDNLFDNAHDALLQIPSARTIHVSSRYLNKSIEIRIRDNGPGIPKKDQAQVFDAFFSTKSQERGTGIGLFIVSNFVAELAGKITCSSEIGKGTEFCLTFPAERRH